jgi:bifunctional non-homologous end joining protein LigD
LGDVIGFRHGLLEYDFRSFSVKTKLERLLALRPEGIFVNPFERGEIGPDLFAAACRMGLEGLVSKRRDRPYQAGRSKHWVKVKNRKHPAMTRVMEAWS